MARRIALPRAVNVGGAQVAMADIKAMLLALGFSNPRSLGASGNLVADGWAGSDEELERLLERTAAERLGLNTSWFVRSPDEWAQIIRQNPFPAEAAERPAKLVVMLLKAPLADAAAAQLAAAITGPERMAASGRTLYVDFPGGQGRSMLDRDWRRTKLAPLATARNWNTVLKLAEMARA